jgi:hypothetical protein
MSMRFWPCLVLAAAVLLRPCLGPVQAQLAPPPAQQKPAKKAKLVQRTYSVADLVIPIDGPPRAACAKGEGQPSPAKTQEEVLIATIKNTVAPQSWSDMGGRGTIDYFPLGLALVVKQTPKIQEQVAELLAALRRLQEAQVAVEIVCIALSEPGLDRLAKQCGLHPSNGSLPAASLTREQARRLMETAQADRDTDVMFAPKLSLPNGQTGTFSTREQNTYVTRADVEQQADRTVVRPKSEVLKTAWSFSVQPVISADRRFVRMRVGMKRAGLETVPVPLEMNLPPQNGETAPTPLKLIALQPRVAKPATGDWTFGVPDRGTVVLGGWREMRLCPDDSARSALSDVPFLGPLFSPRVATVWKPQTALLLVTPRIIVQREEAQRLSGIVPPPLPMPKGPVTPEPVAARIEPPLATAVEESEAPPAAADAAKEKRIARLLEKYYRACREGRYAEARRYATRALALDPACFNKR